MIVSFFPPVILSLDLVKRVRANSRANNYVEFRAARYDRVICNFERIMRVHDFRSGTLRAQAAAARSRTVNSRFDEIPLTIYFVGSSARPFPLLSRIVVSSVRYSRDYKEFQIYRCGN